MPIENEGNALNWTLRFKHGRITIFLYSEPMTPFSTLKSELLDVLRERYPNGLPNPADKTGPSEEATSYVPIPDSILDVLLAVLVDKQDASKGWEELQLSEGGGGMRDTPKSVGIKDGGVVAFTFQIDHEDDEKMDSEPEFVVQLPSYDEIYGEPQPDHDSSSEEKEDMDEAE